MPAPIRQLVTGGLGKVVNVISDATTNHNAVVFYDTLHLANPLELPVNELQSFISKRQIGGGRAVYAVDYSVTRLK